MISKQSTRSRKVWKIIIIFLCINLIAMCVITKLIYDSSFKRYDPEQLITQPENGIDENLVNELHSFRSEQKFYAGSIPLQGYYYSKEDSEALVVITPGLNASADDYLLQIDSFLDYGWDVFIYDTTGSCASGGDSAVGFSQVVYDLDAALDYVEVTYDYEDIFLFGHSRGGYAVCSMLNSDHDISAAVSISGLNSAMEAVIEPATHYIGSFAYTNYPLLWLYQAILFGPSVVNTDAAEEIAESDVPVLIVQGTQDDVALPDDNSIYAHRDEYEQAPVEYYICDKPGQDGHTNLMYDNNAQINEPLMHDINQFYSKYTDVSNIPSR